MTRIFALLATLTLQAQSPQLPTWLAGCWSGSRGAETFHESWTRADASTLLGIAHTLKGGRMTVFEFLRIVVRDGTPSYIAQPNGVPPTVFTATSVTTERMVFENPAHDFPKRVIYQKVGADRLTASIDGGSDGKGRVDYEMTRQACAQ